MTEDNVKFTKSHFVLALLIIVILKRSRASMHYCTSKDTQDLCSPQYKRSVHARTPFPPSVSADSGREMQSPTVLVRAM